MPAYTRALHGYFDYLDLVGVARDQIETLSFGGHLRWLRTGLLPSVTALGPETPALKETSDRLMPETLSETETEMRIGETLALKYQDWVVGAAEREFLRTQRVGRDGKDLGVSAQDLYDITALSGAHRPDPADRAVPGAPRETVRQGQRLLQL